LLFIAYLKGFKYEQVYFKNACNTDLCYYSPFLFGMAWHVCLAWHDFGFYLTAISTTIGVFYLSKFFGQDISHLKIALLNFLFLFLLFGMPDFVLDLYIDYKLSVLHEGSMEYKKYFNLSIDREWKSLVPVISFMSSFAYSLLLYVVLKIFVLFKKIKN
jgi:hypothetical protein